MHTLGTSASSDWSMLAHKGRAPCPHPSSKSPIGVAEALVVAAAWLSFFFCWHLLSRWAILQHLKWTHPFGDEENFNLEKKSLKKGLPPPFFFFGPGWASTRKNCLLSKMTSEIYYDICPPGHAGKALKTINQLVLLSFNKSPSRGACPWPADISITHLPPYAC